MILLDAYRVSVNIPEGLEQGLMDSIDEILTPLYPGYGRCFNFWPVTGTWIPLPGSEPFIGSENVVEEVREIRVEFAVRAEELETVISRIVEVHPYEEPAIDVLPLIPWKGLIQT